MTRLFALGFAGLVAFATSAPAQIIAYEGFGYTPGSSLNLQNGGSGFSSAWALASGTGVIQSGSLVVPAPANTLAESGNSLTLAPLNDTVPGDATRNLSTPITGTTGTSAWVSVIMKGTGSTGINGQAALFLSDGAGSGFAITTGATGGAINPPANSNWSLGDTTGAFEASSTVSSTIQSLLVAQITFGPTNDTVKLYVNPTPGTTPPGSANATLSLPHTATLSQIEVVDSDLNGASAIVPFDEIRLGNTFADVTPTAVPEPSTLLLTAAGLVLAIRRRQTERRNAEDDSASPQS
jgi:hypothetical protein